MIQPIIGKAPRVERDWESYSYRRSSRGEREREMQGKKKKERKERKRETVRENFVSIDNGCVYGEYDRVKN